MMNTRLALMKMFYNSVSIYEIFETEFCYFKMASLLRSFIVFFVTYSINATTVLDFDEIPFRQHVRGISPIAIF